MHAAAEAQIVGDIMSSRSVHVGPDATVELLLREAPTASIVHVVCHGHFISGAPFMAQLRMTPTSSHDGRLTMAELRERDFHDTRLVVLSACETGVVDIRGGDESLGLTRAFLEAGVPAIVATLWGVDDAFTAEFMRVFYGDLRRGAGPAVALRAAREAFIHSDQYSAPYFWAPFSLLGAA
jgi:CHAT domain-containing protein